MSTMSWIGLASVILVTDILLFWFGYQWCKRRSMGLIRHSAPVKYIENQIDTMNQVIGQLGGCLDTIEQSLEAERSAPKPEPAPVVAKRPEPALGSKAELYRIASRFARRGSGVEELMSDCGLSRGEAQTIANLQRAGLHQP